MPRCSAQIDGPSPNLLTDFIRIAGIAGGAFEANYQFEVTDGHDSVTSFFVAGGGIGGHAQFPADVDVSAASFALSHVFVHVYYEHPIEGPNRQDEGIVPVLLTIPDPDAISVGQVVRIPAVFS